MVILYLAGLARRHKLFVWLMLMNYVLVVAATNVMATNVAKYTATAGPAKPYVHAPDCQVRFYLQYDCFEKCHGEEISASGSSLPLSPYMFLQASGLDFHHQARTLTLHSAKVCTKELLPLLFAKVSDCPGFIAIPYPPPNFD